MDDESRLDWLAVDMDRLQKFYWHLANEACTIREAIDWLAIWQNQTAVVDPKEN